MVYFFVTISAFYYYNLSHVESELNIVFHPFSSEKPVKREEAFDLEISCLPKIKYNFQQIEKCINKVDWRFELLLSRISTKAQVFKYLRPYLFKDTG